MGDQGPLLLLVILSRERGAAEGTAQLILTHRHGEFNLELPHLSKWLPLQGVGRLEDPQTRRHLSEGFAVWEAMLSSQPARSRVTPFTNHQ